MLKIITLTVCTIGFIILVPKVLAEFRSHRGTMVVCDDAIRMKTETSGFAPGPNVATA